MGYVCFELCEFVLYCLIVVFLCCVLGVEVILEEWRFELELNWCVRICSFLCNYFVIGLFGGRCCGRVCFN